jgi:hypothetical protein
MPKKANRQTPIVIGGRLYTDDAFTGTVVGSSAWFVWLATGTTFYYQTAQASFAARREPRRHGFFWYAFCKRNRTLHKRYLGPDAALTPEKLAAVAHAFETAFSINSQPSTPDA